VARPFARGLLRDLVISSGPSGYQSGLGGICQWRILSVQLLQGTGGAPSRGFARSGSCTCRPLVPFTDLVCVPSLSARRTTSSARRSNLQQGTATSGPANMNSNNDPKSSQNIIPIVFFVTSCSSIWCFHSIAESRVLTFPTIYHSQADSS